MDLLGAIETIEKMDWPTRFDFVSAHYKTVRDALLGSSADEEQVEIGFTLFMLGFAMADGTLVKDEASLIAGAVGLDEEELPELAAKNDPRETLQMAYEAVSRLDADFFKALLLSGVACSTVTDPLSPNEKALVRSYIEAYSSSHPKREDGSSEGGNWQ